MGPGLGGGRVRNIKRTEKRQSLSLWEKDQRAKKRSSRDRSSLDNKEIVYSQKKPP